MTKIEFLQQARQYLDHVNKKITDLYKDMRTCNIKNKHTISEEINKYEQKKIALDQIDVKLRILKDSEWEVNKPYYLKLIELNPF